MENKITTPGTFYTGFAKIFSVDGRGGYFLEDPSGRTDRYIFERYGQYVREYKRGKSRRNVRRKILSDPNLLQESVPTYWAGFNRVTIWLRPDYPELSR